MTLVNCNWNWRWSSRVAEVDFYFIFLIYTEVEWIVGGECKVDEADNIVNDIFR